MQSVAEEDRLGEVLYVQERVSETRDNVIASPGLVHRPEEG